MSRAAAERTALAKVPGGKVKSSELGDENGKLIWSFDLNTPGSKRITEVGVNAVTGEIVEKKVETAKDEAKEAAEDKAKVKKTGGHADKR